MAPVASAESRSEAAIATLILSRRGATMKRLPPVERLRGDAAIGLAEGRCPCRGRAGADRRSGVTARSSLPMDEEAVGRPWVCVRQAGAAAAVGGRSCSFSLDFQIGPRSGVPQQNPLRRRLNDSSAGEVVPEGIKGVTVARVGMQATTPPTLKGRRRQDLDAVALFARQRQQAPIRTVANIRPCGDLPVSGRPAISAAIRP